MKLVKRNAWIRNMVIVLLITGLNSCEQKIQNRNTGNNNLSIEGEGKTEHAKTRSWTQDENADALRLDSVLNRIMNFAEANKTKPSFQGQINSHSPTGNAIRASYQFGSLFSKDKKHLLIRRYLIGKSVHEELYSDIYLLDKLNLIKLVADTSDIGYFEDTLYDVNSDGFKDYLISSYSTAGCCPRNAKIGYLYNRTNGQFKKEDFFNPEFDSVRKVFYESDYGYPGQISFDKYKWNGLKKLKLESLSAISYGIDSFVKPYRFIKIIYPQEEKQIVRQVPDEYKRLKLYNYFISYQK